LGDNLAPRGEVKNGPLLGLLTSSVRVFCEGVDLDHGGILGHEQVVQVHQNVADLVDPENGKLIESATGFL
jgi:hypothetical protein